VVQVGGVTVWLLKNVTVPLVVPRPVPLIVTVVPTGPEVGEILVRCGWPKAASNWPRHITIKARSCHFHLMISLSPFFSSECAKYELQITIRLAMKRHKERLHFEHLPRMKRGKRPSLLGKIPRGLRVSEIKISPGKIAQNVNELQTSVNTIL